LGGSDRSGDRDVTIRRTAIDRQTDSKGGVQKRGIGAFAHRELDCRYDGAGPLLLSEKGLSL
jgi:hypothetical protein